MTSTTSTDILGSLNEAVRGITGLKTDLSLPETAPFAAQEKRMAQNAALTEKDAALKKKIDEILRQRAVGIQQQASGGAGTNIQAPARIRNRI